MSRKLIILTEGHSNPHTAKTACCLIRYCRQEVVAVLDSTQRGRPVRELLDTGDELCFVGSLEEAPDANTLLIGIAPPGGKIPAPWRAIVLQAISRGMNVLSGLHDFLTNDSEFVTAAELHGVTLTDVRKNSFRDIARRVGISDDCFRLHTVGHDCSVGKMLTSVELTNGLKRDGIDAKFIATGQTGIMIEGDGFPLDCIVADFVSGAAERMILEHQHRQVLVIEGQGSLVHPSYSGVTLSLLHGCLPHALILCYEVGRTSVTGIPHQPIPSLSVIRQLNETMASLVHRCPVIGVSMNSRLVTASEAAAERERVERELELPVCDVVRDGPDRLLETVQSYYRSNAWRSK
ncbi:MAG: DUF1611 domain-containing protein [Planctomycetales bacterium]|nr:DUF1611 domain-containing protein [Planctomycetales bacterium]